MKGLGMHMKVSAAQKLRNMLLIIGFIVMLAAYIWEPFMVIGAIVSCSSLIPHFLYNKCPHCGKQLGRNEEQFCQYCGAKID